MEKVNLKFRKAKLADVPKIVALLSDDVLGEKRENFTFPLPQPYISAFHAIEQDSNQALMVVENEQHKIVASFQLTFIPSLTHQGSLRAQIEGVRVCREDRSKGYGNQLFQWAIEYAKTKGAKILQLTSDKQRPEAIKFYKKLGFEASHEGMKLSL